MEISIIRSKRKTMAIQVDQTGKVIVRAPYRLSKKTIYAFVEQESNWIERQLSNVKRKQKEYAGSLEKLSQDEIQELARIAREVIPLKVEYYANKMGITYGRITIRCQKSRWGSCSSKGNLNFNCLLMLAPEQVIDYVVVHELCHRREMNHSSNFWNEVEKNMPNYREWEKWLKDNGQQLMYRAHG